jgi:hypothetical protein
MASKRAKDSVRMEEQNRKAEMQSAGLVARGCDAADVAPAEGESLWIWELED